MNAFRISGSMVRAWVIHCLDSTGAPHKPIVEDQLTESGHILALADIPPS